jgi:multiple sugar transport system ATP-binding protein
MCFALALAKMPRAEIAQRVDRAAEILGLAPYLDRYPRQLSGGQRQRVAMGRAIVREPQAFLMDEPLSNLDAKLRVQVRAEIARIQRDLGVTTIYVTHDQSEAVTLGDRVCVLRDGVLQQVDRPQVLYDRPANLFVAGFIGSPAMNFVQAELVDRDSSLTARFGPHEVTVPPATVDARAGRRVVLGIRPEDIRLVQGNEPTAAALDVTIDIREDMGAEVFLHFKVDAEAVEAEALKEMAGEEAAEAAAFQHGDSAWIARVARGADVREGSRARLELDTRMLHFFDPETGGSLDAGAVETPLRKTATHA